MSQMSDVSIGVLLLELQTSVFREFDPEAHLTDGTKAVDNQVGKQGDDASMRE